MRGWAQDLQSGVIIYKYVEYQQAGLSGDSVTLRINRLA